MKDAGPVAKDDFDPYVGDEFEIELGGGQTLSLELVSCDARDSGGFEGSPPQNPLREAPAQGRPAARRDYLCSRPAASTAAPRRAASASSH